MSQLLEQYLLGAWQFVWHVTLVVLQYQFLIGILQQER